MTEKTRAGITRKDFLKVGGALAAANAVGASLPGVAASQIPGKGKPDERPNIVFVMTDDHANRAVSAYGNSLASTPNIDRLAQEGVRFDNAFCTNSICTPSRASLLTGTYSHINGCTTLTTKFDSRQPTFPALLQQSGYSTALFGKWHLGHGGNSDPVGFDEWEVLPDQGAYYDPDFLYPGGSRKYLGYVSDIITDLSLNWLDRRDPTSPFCLLVHQKAPHRPWDPAERYADEFEGTYIPEPDTLRDDYSGRAEAASAARMRVGRDLNARDLKEPVPANLSEDEKLSWKYRRYMEDYLRCVASVDDNVGRLLDGLDERDLTKNTLVIYTSDQGFFLGEHGWFDKRFMYEESLRMPFLARLPGRIRPGTTDDSMVLNIDVAQTLLDLAGVRPPDRMQGRSITSISRGKRKVKGRKSIYYRYWMHDDEPHHVRAHYGVRTERYKLIYYYGKGLGVPGASAAEFPPEWELFDLQTDPQELLSVHEDPAYAKVRSSLERELARLQQEYGDSPVPA